MAVRRRRFGPLSYGVLTLAALVTAGLSLRDWWPTWQRRWELRALAADLRSEDLSVSRYATDALAKADAAAVPWLVEAAADRDAGVRLRAVSVLGRIMPLPRAAIPALVAGLRDPDVTIRLRAADALGRFGPEGAAAADGLTRALGDADPEVRFRAARALVRVAPTAVEPALRASLDLLVDPVADHLPNRTVLIPVIRQLGSGAEARTVAVLISMLDAEDPLRRRDAAECLPLLGPAARDATEPLERALRDDDLAVRCLAALALSDIEAWQTGRARTLVQELDGDPALPARGRLDIRWVVSSNLTAGSEFWQPIHILRAMVAEIREAEAQPPPAAEGSADDGGGAEP